MKAASSRKVLNGKGSRLTRQRLLLMDLVRQGGQHLDADELFRLAKQRLPRLSLSTVYRSLRHFKELGLVEELHFDEEHHHYESKPPGEHYHLLCQGCGQVVEFTSSLIPRLKREVGGEKGFQVREAQIHFSGVCSSCQKKSSS